MSNQNERVKRGKKALEGYQFLDCLKLLYCEAIRLRFYNLADVLEDTFQECATALKKEGLPIRDNHQTVVEFNFVKDFRKLDQDQQHLLIESIQLSEIRKMKN